MSRRITFKLSGQDLQVALALQRHVNGNLGVQGDLNQIVKSQFLRFMYSSIDTPKQEDTAGPLKGVQLDRERISVIKEAVKDEGRKAVDPGNPGVHAVESSGPAPGVLADSEIDVD